MTPDEYHNLYTLTNQAIAEANEASRGNAVARFRDGGIDWADWNRAARLVVLAEQFRSALLDFVGEAGDEDEEEAAS